MMIKICGITRREDAVAAAEAGASAIGFIFYKKSPRYIAPERARELGDGLELLKVGVFVDESPALVEYAMRRADLQIAQVYGDAGGVKCERLWLAVRVRDGRLAGFGGPAHEALLLDGSANGVSFDWKMARDLSGEIKIIIAGGLNPSNVAEAIRIAQPWGVDASSGLESAPGVKDHEKVRQFILAAKQAAAQEATT